MKQTDRFLLAIVAGIIMLVAIAFGFILLRPPRTYLPDGSPESSAHNYLFSLEQKDYPRAYSYVSANLRSYPSSAEEFATDIARNRWNFVQDGEATGWAIESAQTTGALSVVTVRRTNYSSGGIFGGSRYSNTFEMRLRQEQGAWKIYGADSYWLYCWDRVDGCD